MKRSLSTSLQNVLDNPWPDHIPKQCPECTAQMNNRVNLFIGYSKEAMYLKRLAPWTSLIVLTAAVLFMIFAPADIMRGLGQGSPMALAAMIAGPPVLLTILAKCIKKMYKLQCHHCSHQTDYPL